MTQQDSVFHIFHKYNRLVRRNIVPPLRCKDCKDVLITTIGPNDALMLECFGCGSKIEPGVDRINNVRAIVEEHFLE